jgi:hypothetical protein
MRFINSKMGDTKIYLGYCPGENIDFLDRYYAITSITKSEDDGMYWGYYCLIGYVPDDDYDGAEGYPAAPEEGYVAIPIGNYELDNAFVEEDNNSDAGDYTAGGWSTLSVETDYDDDSDELAANFAQMWVHAF